MSSCQKLHPTRSYAGKQGFSYFEGISQEASGAKGICMHLLTVPPGGRAKAHKHTDHESAILVLEGSGVMLWGEHLEHRMDVTAGDMVYIPADTPHLSFNPTDAPMRAVIARTDPHEQESVVLLPHLEILAPV